jgi:hypothetical protein
MCPEAGGQNYGGQNYKGQNYEGQNYEEEPRRAELQESDLHRRRLCAGVASTLSAGHFLALLPRVFTDS